MAIGNWYEKITHGKYKYIDTGAGLPCSRRVCPFVSLGGCHCAGSSIPEPTRHRSRDPSPPGSRDGVLPRNGYSFSAPNPPTILPSQLYSV